MHRGRRTLVCVREGGWGGGGGEGKDKSISKRRTSIFQRARGRPRSYAFYWGSTCGLD
jgi:hypothetical protein